MPQCQPCTQKFHGTLVYLTYCCNTKKCYIRYITFTCVRFQLHLFSFFSIFFLLVGSPQLAADETDAFWLPLDFSECEEVDEEDWCVGEEVFGVIVKVLCCLSREFKDVRM